MHSVGRSGEAAPDPPDELRAARIAPPKRQGPCPVPRRTALLLRPHEFHSYTGALGSQSPACCGACGAWRGRAGGDPVHRQLGDRHGAGGHGSTRRGPALRGGALRLAGAARGSSLARLWEILAPDRLVETLQEVCTPAGHLRRRAAAHPAAERASGAGERWRGATTSRCCGRSSTSSSKAFRASDSAGMGGGDEAGRPGEIRYLCRYCGGLHEQRPGRSAAGPGFFVPRFTVRRFPSRKNW